MCEFIDLKGIIAAINTNSDEKNFAGRITESSR